MSATAVAPARPFEFRCLGPVVLARRGGERLRLRTRKQLALLLLLARRQGLPVSRDDLIALLWSDDGESNARHSLSQSISLINKLLGTDVIEPCQKNQLLLRDGTVWLDVAEFEAAIADGRSADAQALWRGGLFEGQWLPRAPNFERWLTDERDRLARQLGAALREVLEAHRTAGDWQPMRKVAEALLDVDALDEGAMLAYLEALALHGERTLALRRYGEFERRLREELDAEPGSALRGWIKRHRKGDGGPPAAVPILRVSDLHVLPAVRPVYGRQEEFALLWERWETAQRSGEGTFLIVQGEAGIGKSALAGKLLNQVHVGGGSVCLARCYRTEKSVPFAPITALIRQLSRLPGFVALGDVWIGELTRLVPELRQRFPNAPQPMAIDESARHRLSDGVVQATECVADEQPLLVVVDDIQEADEASLALLHYLGRSVATQPIFLLCIARSGVQLSEFERTFFDTARAAGLARFVTLGALPDEHIGRIAQQVFAERGLEVAETAVQRVRWVAGGNPLHAIEAALAAPTQDGHFSEEWLEDPSQTPQRGQESFLRTASERLSTLSQNARHVAQVLAIAGRPIPECDLAGATALLPADLASAIQSLEAAHFIRRGGTTLAIVHEQYAKWVEAGIDDGAKRRVHGLLARILKESAAANPSARYEVALHYEGARDLGEARKQSLAAARHAGSMGAVREQASAYELALRVTRHYDADVAVELGSCLLELRDFDGLMELCSSAGTQTPLRSDVRRDLEYFRIAIDYHAGRDRLLAIRNRLVDLLRDSAPFTNRAGATVMLMRVADRTGDHVLARRVARNLRKQDLRSSERRLSRHALQATGFLRAKYYWPESALAPLRQALQDGQQANDWDVEHLCRAGLGAILRQLGRFHESIVELERGLALARRTPNPQAEAASLMDIANAELGLGNFERAAALMEQASAIDDRYPRWMVRCYRYVNSGELYLLTNDLPSAKLHYSAAYDLASSIDLWPVALLSSAGLAMCGQRFGDRRALDRWAQTARQLAASRASVLHDRWTIEAAIAWHSVLVHNDAATAISALDRACRELARRDVDHWLRLELEHLRIARHVGLRPDKDRYALLITAARRHGAAAVLSEAMGLSATAS